MKKNKRPHMQIFRRIRFIILSSTFVFVVPVFAENIAVSDKLSLNKKINQTQVLTIKPRVNFLHSKISVKEQNQVLIEKNTILESEIDILRGQNDRLSKSQRNTWFLYGALSVLMGALLTSFLTSLSRKNKYDNWG